MEPRSYDVAVAVAGTLSVRATNAGTPSVASVPFAASLMFCEVCTHADWENYGGINQDAGGLVELEFTVTLPDDGVLTAEEIELLTSYDFAEYDYDCRGTPSPSTQIGTKSIILLALANQLIQLSHKPKYGDVTWEEEARLQALAAP